jgi:hypothetical protein
MLFTTESKQIYSETGTKLVEAAASPRIGIYLNANAWAPVPVANLANYPATTSGYFMKAAKRTGPHRPSRSATASLAGNCRGVNLSSCRLGQRPQELRNPSPAHSVRDRRSHSRRYRIVCGTARRARRARRFGAAKRTLARAPFCYRPDHDVRLRWFTRSFPLVGSERV